MNQLRVFEQLKQFLEEDLGRGDRSVELFPDDLIDEGSFLLKESGVVCGLWLAPMVYTLLGGDVEITCLVEEGSYQEKGTVIATVKGPVRTLLSGERVILNLWQRMSGIATMTKTAIEKLADPSIRITDTRKTVPGLRELDKYAVTKGGGVNHRMGLDDGIMLKDNHIAFSGSITSAITKLCQINGHMIKIEVEVEDLTSFKEAVRAKADVIMIDNSSPSQIKEFIKHNQGIPIEVSGGISLETIAEFRGCGADYLSLGYLTHSVHALDISFNSQGGQKG